MMEERRNKNDSLDRGIEGFVVPFTEIRTLEKKQVWIWGFKVPKRHARVISSVQLWTWV